MKIEKSINRIIHSNKTAQREKAMRVLRRYQYLIDSGLVDAPVSIVAAPQDLLRPNELTQFTSDKRRILY